MKIDLREFFIALGAAIVACAVFWAMMGIVGISEGSADLCTESFKAAVAWLVGK